MSLRATRLLIAVAAVLTFFAASHALVVAAFPGAQMQRTARSMVGKGKAEVIAALGTPEHVVRVEELKGRDLDYPWAGMNFQPVPTRPITSKVYYYRDGWLAAYIYLDQRDIVEHVAVAGT